MGHNMISTDDPEQAIKDLALFSEKGVMRHHAVGGWDNVNAVWDWAKSFNCDMVLMNDNVACKGMNGVHAMMEEQARDPRLLLHLHRARPRGLPHHLEARYAQLRQQLYVRRSERSRSTPRWWTSTTPRPGKEGGCT